MSTSSADILKQITCNGLMVRPSLTGGWRAGVWKGVTGYLMGQAYCVDGTEWEADTLEEAVETCIVAICEGQLNPQYQELAAGQRSPYSISTDPEHTS